MNINPSLDLVLQKVLDVSPEKVWKAWTTPELFKDWFCPAPWKVVEARIDLRPGGEFYTVMQSLEGDKFPSNGCILEIVPKQKFVWTSALLPEFRPGATGMQFTAEIHLEAQGSQTKYIVIARHGNEEDRKNHHNMGFEQGWGICADQLVALMKKQ